MKKKIKIRWTTPAEFIILTLVEVDLEDGLRMGWRQGVQVQGKGRPVTLPPVVWISKPDPCHHLRRRVFYHLHLQWVLKVRWVVVYVSHVHLEGKPGRSKNDV